VKLQVKPIKASDIPALSAMHTSIFAEWNPHPMKLERDFAPTYAPDNLDGCYGVYSGSRVVGHAASRKLPLRAEGVPLQWAAYGNVMMLSECRGQGAGTELNTKIWDRLEKQGVDGIYISGGRGLYTRMGATHCGVFYGFEVKASALGGRGQGAGGGQSLQVRVGKPADAQALIALHAGEATSFERRPVEFDPALKFGCALLMPGKAWLIESKGRLLAYAIVGPAYQVPMKLPSPNATLVDYAGSRAALLGALPLILKKEGFQTLDFQVAGSDRELLWLLESARIKGNRGTVHGTHMLVNPLRLWKRLEPYFSGRLGAGAGLPTLNRKGKGFEIRWKGKTHRVPDLYLLSKVILGDDPKAWKRLLPAGPFGEVLKQVFPIPFPIIGLSWM
jgi:hypothetical protein